MNKILLLGGTGAMGANLVNLLENTASHVIVTTRKKRPSHNNISYEQGNAHEDDFLVPLLEKGIDIVVDFMVYNTEEFKTRSALMLSHCKQYIYLSSSRVYSDLDDIITEDTPRLLDVCKDNEYLATDEYALTKARQENILKESGKKNWTIIRPYITYSNIRLQLGVNEKETWLFRALHGHKIVFSKDIARHFTTLTFGYDVARGIKAIIGQKEAFGEAFHITQDESMKWSDILEIYLGVIERKTGHRPEVLFREKSPNLQFGKYQVLYDRYYDRKFDNNKIKRFLNTDNFLKPKEGLTKCISEFIENQPFSYISPEMEAKYDRWTHEIYGPLVFQSWKQTVKYYIFRFLLKR